MTIDEAEKLGYRVVAASPFEVGLMKGEQGIRTWWVGESFGGKLPPLDHPKIQEAIAITEEMIKQGLL